MSDVSKFLDASNRRLVPFAVSASAYSFVVANFRDIAMLACLPVLAGVAIDMRSFSTETTHTVIAPPLFGIAIDMVLYVMFAIACHRRYLVGTVVRSPLALLRWKSRHWQFIWRAILLGLILAALSFLVSAVVVPLVLVGGAISTGIEPIVDVLVWIVVYALYGLLLTNFVLTFPAAAVDDHETGLSASGRLINGNQFRLLAILALVAGPFLVFEAASWDIRVAIFAGFGPGLAIHGLLSLVEHAIYYVGVALTATALSITYQTLSASERDEPETTSGPTV